MLRNQGSDWRSANVSTVCACRQHNVPHLTPHSTPAAPQGMKAIRSISDLFTLPVSAVVSVIDRAATAIYPSPRYATDLITALSIWFRWQLVPDSVFDLSWRVGEALQGMLMSTAITVAGRSSQSVQRV